MKLVNWQIVKQPFNWAIILLMLILAGIGGHLLLTYFGHEPASREE